jgi:hypothetical protein
MNLSYLASVFADRGYEWSFTEGRRVPTQQEIEDFVRQGVEQLQGEDDLTQIEFGRLILQKQGSHYDIYVHAGEVKSD